MELHPQDRVAANRSNQTAAVIGHREGPGRPALYATTKSFLDDLGLKSLDQLPSLEANLPDRLVDTLTANPDSGAPVATLSSEA